MKHGVFVKLYKYSLVICLALLMLFIPKHALASAAGDKIIVDNDLTSAVGQQVTYDGNQYSVGTDAFSDLDDAIEKAKTNLDAIILLNQDAANKVYEVDSQIVLNYSTAIDCIDYNSITDTMPIIKPSTAFVPSGDNNSFCYVSGISCAISNVVLDCSSEDFKYGIYVSSGKLDIDNVIIKNLQNSSIPNSTQPDWPFAINMQSGSTNFSEFKNLTLTDNMASGIRVINDTKFRILKSDTGSDSFGLKYYGCDSSDTIDVGVFVQGCDNASISDSFFYHSSNANTADEKTTAIYATGDMNINVQDTVFSENRLNMVLGASSTDIVSSTVHGCSFQVMDEGENVVVNTNSSATHDFSNNWWDTIDWSIIEGLFMTSNGATVDYLPFMMDEQGSYLSDVTLKDLVASQGDLVQQTTNVQSFSSDVFGYNLILDGNVESVQLTPYTFDSSSSISFKNGASNSVSVTSANAVTVSNIPDEDSTVTFTVINASSQSKTYTINIHKKSTDSSVDYITIDGVKMTGFDYTSNSWQAEVAYEDSTVPIVVTPNQSEATYTINGSSVLSTYGLSVGANNFNIVITAEDGVTTSAYTLTITRNEADADNAYLDDITIDGVSLPDFEPTTYQYVYYVDSAATSVNVSATAQNSSSTISGLGSNLLNESLNDTLILIQVESADQSVTKDYLISVIKNDNTDASLLRIEVDNESIDSFSSLKSNYEINVGDSKDTVSIVAVPTQSSSTVAYSIKYQNSSTYNSITNNSNIVLQFGDNLINIEVTSGSGAKQTYTVNITKGLISSADLVGIDIDNVPISGFSPNITEYFVQVEQDKASVTVQANPAYNDATVSGDGVINLSNGSNIVYINVNSQDGTASKTYKLEVFRVTDQTALLSRINIDSTPISNFNKYTTEYIQFMDSSVESVNISATPLNSSSTVTGTGIKELSIGGNSFDIKVLSEDGSVSEIYNLTIYRGFRSDATLSDIKLDDVSITSFKSDDYDYSFSVPYSKTSLEIWANPTDEYAQVIGLGNKSISVGKNTYKITVTADDDVTTKVYEVVITREEKSTSSSSSSDSSSSSSSSSDSSSSSSSSSDSSSSSSSSSSDSSSSSSSSDSSSSDSSSDSDTDTEPIMIEDKVLVEKINLEDTRNVLEGKETILYIDEDAIIRAIKDVIYQDEDPKNSGENELAVRLPKITSIDDDQSASIGITINALTELFESGVTLKSYLDNFIIDILPKSFDITEGMKNSSGVYISKSVLKTDEINDQLFDENKEVFYAFDFNLKHRNNQSDTKITDIKKHVHMEIEIDSELSKSFNSYNDVDGYELYVFDTVTQSPVKIPFVFDKNEKVIQFDTKSTGKFYFVKDKQAAPNVQKQEQEVKIAKDPEETENDAPNNNMIMIIILITIVIFGVVLYLLIKKFKMSEEEEEEE